MHSVTSNAVSGAISSQSLGGIHFIHRVTSSQSSYTYYKINNFLSYSVITGGVFLLQSRGGELCILSVSRSDTAVVPTITQIDGDERKDVTISTATQSEYDSGTAITIET